MISGELLQRGITLKDRPAKDFALSPLMNSLDPAAPPILVTPAKHRRASGNSGAPRLWGLFIFAMLFVGQLAVVGWFVFRQEGPFDLRWR